MSIHKLPTSPNLENLKKRAKTLLASAKAGDAAALQEIGPYFGEPSAIGLQQAQLVLARGYGFSSWKNLKTHIESSDPSVETGDQIANRFLDFVTVAYGSVPDPGPKRFAQAADLLEQHPDIRTENIYTAAAIGDVERIDHWLDRDPNLINAKGGYFNWAPIMYAAYARLPGASTLAAGLRLLERGADPNAYYMWGGQYKFTALTGAFGEGENGPVAQPEHPEFVKFARALLERGANANDSQAAYNRCFSPDNTCFELLLEYGLAATDKNNWFLCEDDALIPHPSETMHFHLINAIHRGYADRAKLLIDHGVDLERLDDSYETRTKGKTPYQAALLMGRTEIAEALLAAGAKRTSLSPLDTLEVTCLAGDTAKAQEMIAADPTLTEQIAPRQRHLLCDAVKSENRKALATMIALDFDLTFTDGRTPLHEAALANDIESAKMLLAAGADPKQRDPDYFSPPIGWAMHSENEAIIALLDSEEMDIFTAASRGKLDQIKARLAEDSDRLNMRFVSIRSNPNRTWELDWMTPLVYAVLNGQPEAVRLLLERGADITVNDGKSESVQSIAEARENAEIIALIDRHASSDQGRNG